jgi:hypothetical protein
MLLSDFGRNQIMERHCRHDGRGPQQRQRRRCSQAMSPTGSPLCVIYESCTTPILGQNGKQKLTTPCIPGKAYYRFEARSRAKLANRSRPTCEAIESSSNDDTVTNHQVLDLDAPSQSCLKKSLSVSRDPG